MGIEDIEETVRETPEEEEKCDKEDGVNELPAGQKSPFNRSPC